jgi:hypothetical protein
LYCCKWKKTKKAQGNFEVRSFPGTDFFTHKSNHATEIGVEMDIDWGDEVMVTHDAPSQYGPGLTGAVCGIWTIKEESLAQEYNVDVGSLLFTIEYIDGTSQEIPGKYLVKIADYKSWQKE